MPGPQGPGSTAVRTGGPSSAATRTASTPPIAAAQCAPCGNTRHVHASSQNLSYVNTIGWHLYVTYVNDGTKLDCRCAGVPAKRGPVGDFKNGGRELRPKGQPEPVRVHDFVIPELGKVSPYGVYDVSANHGCRLRRREHSALVEFGRRGPLSHGQETVDQRRLRRQQWQPGAPVEAGTSSAGRRTQDRNHGQPPAARHEQVEQDRASPVRVHHAELARQAAR